MDLDADDQSLKPRSMIYSQTHFAMPPYEEMGRGHILCTPTYTLDTGLAESILARTTPEQEPSLPLAHANPYSALMRPLQNELVMHPTS